MIFIPFSMFLTVWAGQISVIEFYGGAEYGVLMQYHSWFFLIFFSRVLYTFGDFEQYFYRYDIYRVVRHKKRERLFFHSVWKLLKKVIVFQVFVFVCSAGFTFLFLPATKIIFGDLWKNIMIYVVLDIFLALFQMVIELCWNSRAGICIVGLYYMLSLLVSDTLFVQSYGKKLMWMLFPNLGAGVRLEACGYTYVFALTVLLAAISVLVLIGRCVAKKKDVL